MLEVWTSRILSPLLLMADALSDTISSVLMLQLFREY